MRSMTILALALGLLLATFTALYAAEKPAALKTGSLSAKGEGRASVMMFKGTVTITGKGDLTIMGVPKVKITGKQGTKETRTMDFGRFGNRPNGANRGQADANRPAPPPPPPTAANGGRPGSQRPGMTFTTYKGFNGKVRITGEKYSVNFAGKVTALSTSGIGQTFLMGKGAYTVTKQGQEEKKNGNWSKLPERGQMGGRPGGQPGMPPNGRPGGPLPGRPEGRPEGRPSGPGRPGGFMRPEPIIFGELPKDMGGMGFGMGRPGGPGGPGRFGGPGGGPGPRGGGGQ